LLTPTGPRSPANSQSRKFRDTLVSAEYCVA
jgi:hypothetical protein